jgi:hypothetical protein
MLDDHYLHRLVLFTSPVLLLPREKKTKDEEKNLILFRRHSHTNISNTDQLILKDINKEVIKTYKLRYDMKHHSPQRRLRRTRSFNLLRDSHIGKIDKMVDRYREEHCTERHGQKKVYEFPVMKFTPDFAS